VGRLEHLGEGSEVAPRQVAAERDDLLFGDGDVLGIAAVEGAPHPAHHRHDLVAWGEAAALYDGVDGAGGFDAEYVRVGEVRR
jgi:hypothetical protein